MASQGQRHPGDDGGEAKRESLIAGGGYAVETGRNALKSHFLWLLPSESSPAENFIATVWAEL
jgi:hypothetical protein